MRLISRLRTKKLRKLKLNSTSMLRKESLILLNKDVIEDWMSQGRTPKKLFLSRERDVVHKVRNRTRLSLPNEKERAYLTLLIFHR